LSLRVRVTLGLAVYRQSVRLDDNSLRLTTSNFIFQLNTCDYSPSVCRLQLLLVLASAVILGSESRGIHDHILLSQIQDSPNLEGQVPVFIFPPGTVLLSYSPRHWVLFSPPLTTRRATGEVFDPAFTQVSLMNRRSNDKEIHGPHRKLRVH
jgi:hypothetical protein